MGQVQKHKYINGAATYSANIVARLVGKDKKVLWTGEGRTGFFASNNFYSTSFSVSTKVADKLSKDLIAASQKDQK